MSEPGGRPVSAFARLLSPVRVGAQEIRNRVVTTATSASESWRNPLLPGEAYVEFARRRAAGGVGLFIAHPCYVNPFGEVPASIADRHAALAEAVHAGGARVIVQLMHFGAVFRTDNDVRRPALWGFDHTVTPEGEPVHRMTGEEVELVVTAYRRAARMVTAAGCDGVELHGGHGYLVQQSLTPWTNGRDDEWGPDAGGDRTAFARRLLDVLREEIGPDRILGYRTPSDDLLSPEDGGLGPDGVAAAVRRLLDTGRIDLLNTTVGVGGASYARAIPNYRSAEAPNIPRLHRLRARLDTRVPMIGTGRIASAGMAEALLERGECELVAMTRAHFAEPELVAKLTSGRAARIRPCVGANVCVNSKLGGSPESTCFHNPEVLRETELMVTPAPVRRRVLVVGAGPAGLKAAEVAARRGHRVRIVDAGARPGGRLRAVEHTAAAPLAGALDHLVTELAELGVTPEPGLRVGQELLRSADPEFVVVATGATVVADLPGAGVHPGGVIGTDRAVGDPAAVFAGPDPVLVYDALGTNEPALVAEELARRGHRVLFVTRYETVMPFGGVLHRAEAPAAWHRRLDRIITGAVLGDLTAGTATIVRPDGTTLAELPVGTVVAAVAPRPSVGLLPVLRALGIPHALAGDALAPRTAANAFREGHQVALTI